MIFLFLLSKKVAQTLKESQQYFEKVLFVDLFVSLAINYLTAKFSAEYKIVQKFWSSTDVSAVG